MAPTTAAPRPQRFGLWLSVTVAGLLVGGYAGWSVALVGAGLLWRAARAAEPRFGVVGPLGEFSLELTARKGHAAGERVGCAAVALLLFALMFMAAFRVGPLGMWSSELRPQGRGEPSLAVIAGAVMVSLAWVVYLVIGAASGGNSVRTDRKKNRIEFVLMAPLTAWEVVAGPTLASLRLGADLLWTWVPLAVVLSWYGEPHVVVIAAGAALGMAGAVGLAGVSAFDVVLARDPNKPGYVGQWGVILYLVLSGAAVGAVAPTWGWRARVEPWALEWLEWLAKSFAAGNPLVLVTDIFNSLRAGAPPVSIWWDTLEPFARFQLALGLAGLCGAAWALRGRMRTTADGTQSATGVAVRRRPSPKPPVPDDRPLTWRDTYCPAAMKGVPRPPWWMRYVNPALMMVMVIASLVAAYNGRFGPRAAGGPAGFLGCLWLWGVSGALLVGASVCVVREFHANTLDDLLLMPVDRRDALTQKLRAVVAGVAWPAGAGLVHWLVVVLAGWVPAVGGLAAVAAGVVFAAAVLAAGTWSGLRSNFRGGVVVGGLTVASVLVLFAGAALQVPGLPAGANALGRLLVCSVPPAGMAWLSTDPSAGPAAFAGLLLGSALWAALGWGFWRLAVRVFERFPEEMHYTRAAVPGSPG